ncbi:Phosphate-specific transport system accessory protein [Corynebacterium deserti GIMN1.010]|uniref:Phosphate-specific transport system accessory protein PhoU n=1 Tax=Corynebacterium deserti GIMN1.010 TaxID=931089 RepID=A0A0M4CF67_9CORY|nr:phosphate signaling complex protein PhoU [Corynebacterium deserti]ALC06691.1 Phosphate-specific transport system accessory protein [Corynebacterium deserti GIMN1.010]
MRTAYRQQLDEFAHNLIILCDLTKECMEKATDALLRTSLASAESALGQSDKIDEVRVACESQAVELLALETPVARDLRQVVSSIYIVEEITRMGALAMHVANSVRRRYPEPVVPEDMRGYFKEMARLVSEMTDHIRQILIDPEPDLALEMAVSDDAVDDLHQHIMRVLTLRPWPHSTKSAVDITLLSRFYERYADHTVNVAARIIYLSTGMHPEEYMIKREQQQQDADVEKRWAEIERQFRINGLD